MEEINNEEFTQMAATLTKVWLNHRYEGEVAYFCAANDLGFPYAYGLIDGDLALTDKGKEKLEQTFNQLEDFVNQQNEPPIKINLDNILELIQPYTVEKVAEVE